MPNILVVDDEQSICWGIARLGESLGHEVVAASSAEQALEQAEQKCPDVVILDVRLPGMDGLAAIERFHDRCGTVPIIVITAYGDLQTAVEAVRRGAFDYIAKPFDVAKVKGALVRALCARRPPGSSPPTDMHVAGIVGRSPAMQEVYKHLALGAASEVPVLLCGESGTGKELAARAIHRYSSRADGPFVAVNVASLSSSLAESELFGHVRGAFTGAEGSRVGLLAQASGGTLFLDEVADIPLPTQVKLLRALEHGEVTPVGGNESIATDFRVISATHQVLAERVEDGLFRHDLYFRLGVFQINLPSLRERGEDISELAGYFIAQSATRSGGAAPVLTPDALAELERRTWLGNVRELRNAIEHAVILARGRSILPEHLPPPVALAPTQARARGSDAQVACAVNDWAQQHVESEALSGRVYERLMEVIEPPLLRVAVERHQGQCAAAARTLGLHRTTLRKKLLQQSVDTGHPDSHS